MLARILAYECASSGASSAALRAGSPLALLVNNLGGSSNLELTAVAHEALAWLRAQGVRALGRGVVGVRGGGGCVASLQTPW